MKHTLTFLFLCSCLLCSAQPFEIDGITYIQTSSTSVDIMQGSCPTGNVVIPSQVSPPGSSNLCNVKFIRGGALANCSNITSVSIPATVTRIDPRALGSISITNINVDSSNPWYTIISSALCKVSGPITELVQYPLGKTSTSYSVPNSVNHILNAAFADAPNLKNISLPQSLESMGYWAFSNSALESISIPSSVHSIGKWAFSDCQSLTSVDFSVAYAYDVIQSSSFNNCTSLSNIVIPDNVTLIGGSAFNGCTSLTSIHIPGSVSQIESYAFAGCASLSSVTNLRYTPQLGSSIFYLTDLSNSTLHVPYGSEGTYGSASHWNNFGTIAPIGELAQQVVDQCFDGIVRSIDASNNTSDVYFHDEDGKLICMINGQGNNLGDVSVKVNRTPGTRSHENIPMLGRNITISPTTQPSTPVKVRLYYTSDEMITGTPLTDVDFSKTSGVCAATYGGGEAVTVQQVASGSIFNTEHYIETSVTSFSTLYASPQASELTSTLPVDFISVSAEPRNSNIELSWATASEYNNDRYDIEHSMDGKSWSIIGSVAGAGTSTKRINYNYTHDRPIIGQNYYRIKQVDFDGRSDYSKIARVKYEGKSFRIYPNPVHHKLYFDRETKYKIYTPMGILLFSGEGREVDLINLESGIYFCAIEGSLEKIIKL